MTLIKEDLVRIMNKVPDDIFMLALEYKIKEEKLKKLCLEKNILFLEALSAIEAAEQLNKLDSE